MATVTKPRGIRITDPIAAHHVRRDIVNPLRDIARAMNQSLEPGFEFPLTYGQLNRYAQLLQEIANHCTEKASWADCEGGAA